MTTVEVNRSLRLQSSVFFGNTEQDNVRK